jgi:hypothetical protein
MLGRAKALLLTGALALTTPVAAQTSGPTTTAFDGKYVGVSTESIKDPSAASTKSRCWPYGTPDLLTITNGVVQSTGGWEGTVTPQGALVMRDRDYKRVVGQIDSQGNIRGQHGGTPCDITYVWRKQRG